MYAINGIDLQSSEYDELEANDRGEDVDALASRRLRPDGSLDDMAFEVYAGLESAGLVAGFATFSGFVFSGLTQKGIDFIRDYEKSIEDERTRTREQRIHDYKVASYGAIAGGILGLFSGALGSWLLDGLRSLLSR